MIYDYEVTTGNGDKQSLADYKGKVVARFEPTADMKKVRECIEALL